MKTIIENDENQILLNRKCVVNKQAIVEMKNFQKEKLDITSVLQERNNLFNKLSDSMIKIIQELIKAKWKKVTIFGVYCKWESLLEFK